MPYSMVHWNGNQLAAMDVETTGLRPGWHEIWQIAILPLDSNIEPRRDVLPFNIQMKPESPERIDWTSDVMKGNKDRIHNAFRHGFCQEKGKDLLREWVDKLGLPLNKGGVYRCKLIPLGQHFTFDKPHIMEWLGYEEYNELFHFHHRDTMQAALYLNDRAGMHCENVPFPKVGLSYLCSQLKLEHGQAHDALYDCVATASVYKELIRRGLLG